MTLPPVDPVAVTEAAFASLDKNSDGFIDADEILGSPALSTEFGEYDADGDKQISKEELQNRLIEMYSRKIALSPAECKVTLNGKVLRDATVRYIPESFMGEGTTHPAEGVTNGEGITKLSIAPDLLPEDAGGRALMQPGLYRVEITHPSIKILPKYNTETTLGYEQHWAAHYGPNRDWDLKSK